MSKTVHVFCPKSIPCTWPGCKTFFKSTAGRKRHINSVHALDPRSEHAGAPPLPAPQQPRSDEEVPSVTAGDADNGLPHAYDKHGAPAEDEIEAGKVMVEEHPALTGAHSDTSNFSCAQHSPGIPCNAAGQPLPPGAPPSSRPGPRNKDYRPYESRIQFEIADFLYREVQMSGNHIDKLMSLWNAHSSTSPFADHQHLYSTIDATPLADIEWRAFTVTYTGPRPDGEVPAWMEVEYTVYYRCPRQVLHAQLGNRKLHGEIDYTPKKIYRGHERVLENFMSGDWVWTQAVCLIL